MPGTRLVAIAIAAACVVAGMATEARAQNLARPELLFMTQLPGSSFTLPPPPAQIQFRPTFEEAKPSNLMRSLYVTTATMQALDVHSTFASLNQGGVEANPMMSGLSGHPVAFSAVKAGVAATSIFAAHKLAKRNKAAAIALLVGINSAYAFVVSHNYRDASQMGR